MHKIQGRELSALIKKLYNPMQELRKSRVTEVIPDGAKRNYELLALLKDPSPKLRMTEAGYLKYIDWPEGGKAVMPEERKEF